MSNLLNKDKSKSRIKSRIKDKRKNKGNNNISSDTLKDQLEKHTISTSLKDNIDLLKNNILKDDSTIIYRDIKNSSTQKKFCLVFVNGMIDKKVINENVIFQVMNYDPSSTSDDRSSSADEPSSTSDDRSSTSDEPPSTSDEFIDYLKEQVIIADDIKESNSIDEMISAMLYGDAILFINEANKALILSTKGWETRSISEPQSETIINGPREGFNESINTNMSLIRRKITSPNLKFKMQEIGVRTRTKVCVAYIDGIVNPKILKKLEDRLSKIDIEGVFSSQVIQELIDDNPLSPFKTIGDTERPDVVASKLLQGRIAVLCDGSPRVITLPFLFIEYFQVNEDYYENFIYASFNRIVRILALILTTATPAIFVAILAFHKEILPTRLALSIFLSRESVPFPIAIECLLMLIIFEILREAGIRLPKHIGSTVSIVGALILGEAAVSARFIGAGTVIIISITGICGLILYEMRTAVLVIRLGFLFAASIMGLYGIIFSSIGLTIYLVSIKSFGIPYMLKIIDVNKYNVQDTGIRAPWQFLKYRTRFISKDLIRSKNYAKGRK